MLLRLNMYMYVCGVRLQDFSHLQWQKLNIEQYSSGSPFAAFRSQASSSNL